MIISEENILRTIIIAITQDRTFGQNGQGKLRGNEDGQSMEISTSQEVLTPPPSPFYPLLSVNIAEQCPLAQLPAFSRSISRLSFADASLFRTAFQQEPPCYANSWLYLLRSTRNEQGECGYK